MLLPPETNSAVRRDGRIGRPGEAGPGTPTGAQSGSELAATHGKRLFRLLDRYMYCLTLYGL